MRPFRTLLPLVLALLCASDAWAVFDLQVTPRRGGQNIRFEESEPGGLLRNEELTAAVISTEGAPYRIYQTLYQPLTNERGDVIPQHQFIQFSPTNTLGNLRVQIETPVTMGQTTIYTSNGAGESDTFVLVLNVRVPEGQPGGVYHTQLTFQAEPTSPRPGMTTQIVTLDVRVEIRPRFRADITGVRGSRKLDLGKIDKDHPDAAEALAMQIESNVNAPYRILYQLTEPLASSEGIPMEGAFTLSARSERGGRVAQSEEVAQAARVLYTSENGGPDALELAFRIEPAAAQKAGTYQGLLRFWVESSDPRASSWFATIPVRVTVEAVFDLTVDFAGGDPGLAFGLFKDDAEKERTLILRVRSNLGKPYQVTQVVSKKLTNPGGEVIPVGLFQFFGDKSETGKSLVTVPTEVKEGESSVFLSDDNGSPEEVTLHYRLRVPLDQRSGLYNAEIKYSITTL